MRRPAKAKARFDVVDWLDSLPPERKKLLRKAADNAEKLWKASHG